MLAARYPISSAKALIKNNIVRFSQGLQKRRGLDALPEKHQLQGEFTNFLPLAGVSIPPKPLGQEIIKMNKLSFVKNESPQLDPSVTAASYARFSSDMQRDESISDQQRKCHEQAAANGHTIVPELEFADKAVSGTKRHRDGLDAMLAAAEAGEFKVLYLHSLSRLSRESVITLPLMKQLVYNYGVRVVSVTEGIDTDNTAWDLTAHVMSIVHEQYIKDLSKNVLRGQEGAVLAGFSVGDHCFGYSSAAVPGSEQGRHGRKAKPRMIYVIDAETAAWVLRIFKWFVDERLSLREITRELNRLGAPKDHRSTTPQWRHQYLSKLLQNRKYIGDWPWAQKKNVRDPLTGKIRQQDRSPQECEKWTRRLPHLRLVDDETFAEAQRILKANQSVVADSRKKNGKLKGSKRGAGGCHPRHILSQLIVCEQCGRVFSVGGPNGRYLFCPGHHMGTCPCRTQLRRDRAERMILDEIGSHILDNPDWRKLVQEETLKAWNAQEATVPSELEAARRGLAEVERKIGSLIDRIEDDRGGPELDARLAQRRAEKRDLAQRVDRLQRTDQSRPARPTESWIEERLANLGEVLSQGPPAAAHALRDLVGGKIVVSEMREPGRQRFYLQGRFAITGKAIVERLVGTDAGCGSGAACDSGESRGESRQKFVIDFRETPKIETQSQQAKQLYDRGLLYVEIAKEMGCNRSYVTKLLKHWFASRGEEMPNGYKRRSTLKNKQVDPTIPQKIADDAMALYRKDMLLQDIAAALEVDRNTITAAIRWWHESRDLPVPDGRTRRKGLEQKVSVKSNESAA